MTASGSLAKLKTGAANGVLHQSEPAPIHVAGKKLDRNVQGSKHSAEKAKTALNVVNGLGTNLETNGVMQSSGQHRNGSSQADEASTANGHAVPAQKAAAGTPASRTVARTGAVNWSEMTLLASYKPSDTEPFMNAKQRLYFRVVFMPRG